MPKKTDMPEFVANLNLQNAYKNGQFDAYSDALAMLDEVLEYSVNPTTVDREQIVVVMERIRGAKVEVEA
ncbi:MAG: hypothetical protein P1V36_00250 [Planctomycetota bacterium]|nr:hypothetical protein [Planctomycetota bacterium]